MRYLVRQHLHMLVAAPHFLSAEIITQVCRGCIELHFHSVLNSISEGMFLKNKRGCFSWQAPVAYSRKPLVY
ncbi:hypothetical protein BKA82DRAFT_717713 [Pisolithus tinctorius]|uniref:Uncharacterized protein n=1 Tax=Pisolithus tinctorius Marx 270 TaxID=870435 RepID=A0A0C3IYQ5_PISTI|nr:hypothetical protein BKA82DRAFT_717713 [Pisolithus tinctorius]KIO01928.1 hypothetical protein M404DRAFT_717713 [Pisolithus tinctorius Marx 270]